MKIVYFVTHPIILVRNRLVVQSLKRKVTINSNWDIKSELQIDVVFPTIAKDFEVVGPMIDSVRQYLKHPVENIYIISPPTEEIKTLCKQKGCVYVDENTLLPITIKDIKYTHLGINRSGWLFQQLLKWGASTLGRNRHFLVTESDTVFIRPRVFEDDGKFIIPCSNEFPHIPYYKMYEKLLGEKVEPILNLTAHHCLYDKVILNELKDKIEKNCGNSWFQSIINNIDLTEGSCVSEYETYQQYINKNHPDKVKLEYWGNISLPRSEVKNLPTLSQELKDDYKVISFHSYNI